MKAQKRFPADQTLTGNYNQDEMAQWITAEVTKSGALEGLILEYEYGKGKLQQVQMVPESLSFKDETSGSFKASYELNEFSLCAAIDYTASNYMIIDFELDKAKNEITLNGEEIRERSDEI
ncbi:MAG TPA: hypothetical protein VKB19_00995 [Pedobacter sp.]|nr:hypothetical protein [Pedobacter sp.]